MGWYPCQHERYTKNSELVGKVIQRIKLWVCCRELVGRVIQRIKLWVCCRGMLPGVAASQDFLKVFLESEFRVESDSQKLHLGIDFESLAIQFLNGFWISGEKDPENVMTLVFSGFNFIIHSAHHFANFGRSLRKSFSGELRPGWRPKSRFCHIFVSLSRLNRPTAVKFCTGVELSRVSRMTV